MNPLIDDFPCELCGVPIDTDYRRMVQFELLMLDEDIPAQEKLMLGIELLYKTPVTSLPEAWDRLLWFYRGGGEVKGDAGTTELPPRVYDFEQDADRIYTAFLQIYGIDLQETPVHWWKFRALLFTLPGTCLMGKIMYYRSVDVGERKGAGRKHALHMRSLFALDKPTANMTQAERDAAFLAIIDRRQKQLEAQWKRTKGGA